MRIGNEPDKNFCVFMLTAGHGLLMEGGQALVINEYNVKTRFYKLLRIENWIRTMAKQYRNTYFIGVFACCR